MTAKGGPGQDPNESGSNTHTARGDTPACRAPALRRPQPCRPRALWRSGSAETWPWPWPDPRPAPHLRPRSSRRGWRDGRLQGAGRRAGCSLPVGPHGRPVHTSPQRPHFPHLRRRFLHPLAATPPHYRKCSLRTGNRAAAAERGGPPISGSASGGACAVAGLTRIAPASECHTCANVDARGPLLLQRAREIKR